MSESVKWKRLYLLAMPIVRSTAWRMGVSLGLRFHDRQDLEQQIWLELLVRHAGRDKDDRIPGFLDECHWRQQRSTARSQLQREVERIATALARSWPFWRRVRPAPERFSPFFAFDELTAFDPQPGIGRHDLSLDLTELLSQLPAADRRLCESLMNDATDSSQYTPANCADMERRLAALRSDMAALHLQEYL